MRWHLDGPPINGPWRMNLDSRQAPGLQSWFPIVVGSFYDAIGRAGAGDFIGNPRIVRDQTLGNALYFDGSSCVRLRTPWDYGTTNVLHGLTGMCNAIAPVSTMFWVNSPIPATRQTYASDYNQFGDHAYCLYEFGGYLQTAAHLTTYMGASLDSGVVAAANTWYHVATTYAGAPGNLLKLYINGVLKNSAASVGDVWATGRGTLGRGGDYPGLYFTGMMADVRFYRRELTAEDIAAIYDPTTRWDLYTPISRQWALPVAGPEFRAAWAARRNILLSGGIN